MKCHNVGLPLIASILSVSAAPAVAGTVAGKIEVGTTGIPNAVVSIEGAPGTVSPRRAIINQQGKTFIPHVSVVTKGSIIELLNSDDFLHNTYSRSPAKVFNTNQPSQGSRSLVKVDQPGVIEVRCHIHGQMQAWVIVVDTPYFGTTDSRGIFSIPAVPAGTYRLKVWSERGGELTQVVRVPKAGMVPVIVKYAGR